MISILIITAVFCLYTVYLYKRTRLGVSFCQSYYFSIDETDYDRCNERNALQSNLDRNILEKAVFYVFYACAFAVGFRLCWKVYDNYFFYPLVFILFSVAGYFIASNPTEREENRPVSVYAMQINGRYTSMRALCFFYVMYLCFSVISIL